MFSCDGWQLHVNEGYTELPTQSIGDFLGGTLVDKPKGGQRFDRGIEMMTFVLLLQDLNFEDALKDLKH